MDFPASLSGVFSIEVTPEHILHPHFSCGKISLDSHAVDLELICSRVVV